MSKNGRGFSVQVVLVEKTFEFIARKVDGMEGTWETFGFLYEGDDEDNIDGYRFEGLTETEVEVLAARFVLQFESKG
jgi:hypothetical protein